MGVMLATFIAEYEDRTATLDRMTTRRAGWFRAVVRRRVGVLDAGGARTGGTERAGDRSLATRDVRDFGRFDIDVVSPWEGLIPFPARARRAAWHESIGRRDAAAPRRISGA